MDPVKVSWRSKTFFALAMHEILSRPLEGESASSRQKQLSIINILYYLHQEHRPLTLAILVDITGLTRSAVVETVDQLVKRNLLTQTIGTNSMGRGTARQFQISEALLGRLGRDLRKLVEA